MINLCGQRFCLNELFGIAWVEQNEQVEVSISDMSYDRGN